MLYLALIIIFAGYIKWRLSTFILTRHMIEKGCTPPSTQEIREYIAKMLKFN